MGVLQIKHFSARRVLFLLIGIISLSSFVSMFGYNTPAYAATNDECYAKFNDRTYRYSDLSIADQTLVNQCRSEGFCLVKTSDANLGNTTLSCANPASLPGDTGSNAAGLEVGPLVIVVCGSAPASDTLMESFLRCAANVRKIYASCDNTGGPITSNMQDTDANTARCIMGKLSNPKPSPASVTAAVKDGRAAAIKSVEEAINTAALGDKKKKCEERIKNGEKVMWNGSDCVAATAATNTCNVKMVGWIVCPTLEFIADGVDLIYLKLITPLMAIPPIATDTSGPLYKTWATMRDLANILFIIAFLIVVYSQVTSAGISNYGVKKMLPRLIVAAILINTSFWLCALAVDLSNLIGASLYRLLETLREGTPISINWLALVTVILSTAAAAGAVAGAIAILPGAGPVLLWLVIPLVLAALIAVFVALIVLALRQALVVVLIITAPLAFAAYLLPNTQSWFDKWRKGFITVLIFYPLFSLIVGGSLLASRVLIGVSGQQKDETSMILLVVGLSLQAIPLFLAPWIAKFSGGAIGSVASKFQGGAAKLTKPVGKMARGRAGQSLGLTKSRMLAGDAQATNRFGRRTIGARASGAMQKFDTRTRTNKLESDMLNAGQEVGWQGKIAQDPNLKDIDTKTQASKLEGDMYNARREADFAGHAASSSTLRSLDEATRTAKLEKGLTDATQEADWQEGVATDSNLRNLGQQVRATNERGKSAERVQTENYLEDLKTAGSPLAATAGGIDPHGATRAQASAIQADFKAFDEHVSAEKSLMSDRNVNVDKQVSKGFTPAAGSLDAIVRDDTLSIEERSAAASRLIDTGADKNIHELLDYLGTTTDTGARTIQKQVAGDLSQRKPKSLGQADVSALSTGTYGTFAPPHPTTGVVPDGRLDSKVTYRVEAGKQSGESLASAGVDELDRMITVLGSARPATGTPAAASRAALVASIDQYYTSAATSGRQVPAEIKSRMDSIKGVL